MKTTRSRRIFAIILTVLMFVALLPASASAAPAEALAIDKTGKGNLLGTSEITAAGDTATLASWAFTDNTLPKTATSGIFAASSVFSHYANRAVSYTSSSATIYTDGWDGADQTEKYWQLVTSSAGYENLSISFRGYGSNTAPKNFILQYSTDGSTYTEVESYVHGSSIATYNINLPAGANDAANLYLRFQVVGTVSISNGIVASGGNSRMANITITGIEKGGATTPQCGKPTSTPASGAAVEDGATVTLSSATAGAGVYYTMDGSTPDSSSTLYTGPITLSFGAASSITIRAIAVLADYDDSEEAVFIFNKEVTATPVALAAWSFVSGDTATTAKLPQNATEASIFPTSQFSHYAKTDVAYTASSASVYTGDWDNASDTNQKYWQIVTSSKGYKNLYVDFNAWGTDTSPKNFVLEYSTDGSTFMAATNYALMNSANNNYKIDLPAEASDAETLTLRFRVVGTESIRGDTVAAGGNSRMANVTITGAAIGGTTPPISEVGKGPITFYQIYSGGGNSGAVYHRKYIVLKNIGATAVDIGGWSMWRASATGVFSTNDPYSIPEGTILPAGAYCFIPLGGVSETNGAAIPEILDSVVQLPENVGFSMSATNAKVALCNNQGVAPTGPDSSNVVDYVAYGSSSPYLGTGAASATTNSTGLTRIAYNGDNATDYSRVTPDLSYIEDTTPDTTLPVITLPDPIPSAEVGADYTLGVTITDNKRVAEAALTYTIGTETQTVPFAQNTITKVWEAKIPGSEIIPGTTSIDCLIKASDPSGNTAEAALTVPVVDVPKVIEVSPAPKSITGTNLQPEISVKFSNAGTNPTVRLTLNGGTPVNMTVTDHLDGTFTAAYTPADPLTEGDVTAKVTITRTEDGAFKDHEWSFTAGESKMRLYFGQLHSHTAQYSDGNVGTLRDAYDYVLSLSDSQNVDFVAVTDHSNYFDTSGNPNAVADINDATKGTLASGKQITKWQEAKQTTEEYNALGSDRVFLYGYEMTWSGGPGHMNTFNTEGFVSRNNSSLNNKTGDAGMKLYYETLTTAEGSVSMFNHPGTTFGTFADFAYWSPAYDEMVTMIEVGNGAGAIRSSKYWPSYEYYTLALDKGWHVAPANNQDNHDGLWGNSNTARSVILTDDFTEQGIYDALSERRMYATEDHNLEIYYYLNDMTMGSILDDIPETVRIHAEIYDPDLTDKISMVSVIVNGGITAYSQTFTSNTATLDVTLPNDYSYYYIRVDQADKDIAVTAPVWTNEVAKVGITSLTYDVAIPVKDEQMNLTTKLYNFEAQALVIDSIEYTVRIGQNTQVIATIESPFTLPAGEEATHTQAFTPTAVGLHTVAVTVYATLGDVPYVFTKNFEMNVLDASELINIAIDAAHGNFYVSGNYADSDVNFIELCAQNGVRVHRLTERITYDAIKDMEMLVLTVPFRGANIALQASDLYTQSELAAIALYAENGGNLIVCSKSDRLEPAAADQKASVITNEILEAIGAKARIAAGIVVDNVEKTNEAFRITFGADANYNYDNPFAKDIKEITNNQFSCYNGAPIIANGADAFVKGYSTTWATNYDNVFTGASYVPVYGTDPMVVPMGEANLMVSETLSGGGFLITSGVTFFSTFEVKVEMENAATLQNSNYQIVINIINMLLPEPTITAIEDVHAAEEGLKFTIEGVVTSNASGYDRDTAFFDCIYVQDATRGINLFPVADDYKIGDVVRVTGTTSSFEGERQLAVSKIEKIGEETPITPAIVTAAEAMSPDNTGNLLQVSGIVESVERDLSGSVQSIMVKDGTGSAYVFINGYIMQDYIGLNDIKVGDSVTAIGLGSVTVEDEGFVPRLRVRDRSEITYSAGSVSIASVVADNGTGKLTIQLDPIPSTAPTAEDFTITWDGGLNPADAAQAVTNFTYDPATGTITYDFTPYATWTAEQRITFHVLFNGVTTDSNEILIPGVPPAEEIEIVFFNAGTVSVQKNEKITLEIQTNPEIDWSQYKISWTSLDKTIASVNSSGVVSGKNYGLTIITATITDLAGNTTSLDFYVMVY